MIKVKILILTGPLYPQPGNNANLISKLIPFLEKDNDVRLAAAAPRRETELSEQLFGVPVHWIRKKNSFKTKYLIPAVSRAADPDGFSDYIVESIIKDGLKEIRKEYPFDLILSTMEPFPAASAAIRMPGVKKTLYIMDPPGCVSGGRETKYRNKTLKKILSENDLILTTPFITEALEQYGYSGYTGKIKKVGFPMIEDHSITAERRFFPDDGKISLLFCGWLYSKIRSPEYFLRILEQLDDSYRVCFMGKECNKLRDRYSFDTKAEILTLPQQPYVDALAAMQEADILINIGNSVPVHMPSKTLEYINTGKPMVNFYKFEECPTLYYTKRYPLCLNLCEKDEDVRAAADRFDQFCRKEKGRIADRTDIVNEFRDCTPGFIADQIKQMLR